MSPITFSIWDLEEGYQSCVNDHDGAFYTIKCERDFFPTTMNSKYCKQLMRNKSSNTFIDAIVRHYPMIIMIEIDKKSGRMSDTRISNPIMIWSENIFNFINTHAQMEERRKIMK